MQLAVVDSDTITKSIDLRAERQGAKFTMADADTGRAPENVAARQVGEDLHLSLGGTGYDEP
jgi:hypothetical protein